MTNLDIVNKLKELNLYKPMLAKGTISLKVDFYLQVFESYKEYRITCENKMDAITFTADDFRISEPTVYNAIKFFKL